MTRKLGKSRAAFRLNTRRASRKAYSNVSSLGRRRHKSHRRRRAKGSSHGRCTVQRGGADPPSGSSSGLQSGRVVLRPIPRAAEAKRLAVNAICPHCNMRYDGKKDADDTDSDSDEPRIEYIHGENKTGSLEKIGAMLICKQPTCRKFLGAISIT